MIKPYHGNPFNLISKYVYIINSNGSLFSIRVNCHAQIMKGATAQRVGSWWSISLHMSTESLSHVRDSHIKDTYSDKYLKRSLWEPLFKKTITQYALSALKKLSCFSTNANQLSWRDEVTLMSSEGFHLHPYFFKQKRSKPVLRVQTITYI